jgi:hypothetical protein
MNKKLERLFRDVERKYQAYQALPNLNNAVRLQTAVGEMDDALDDVVNAEADDK